MFKDRVGSRVIKNVSIPVNNNISLDSDGVWNILTNSCEQLDGRRYSNKPKVETIQQYSFCQISLMCTEDMYPGTKTTLQVSIKLTQDATNNVNDRKKRKLCL